MMIHHIPVIMSLIVVVLGIAMFMPAGEARRKKSGKGPRSAGERMLVLVLMLCAVAVAVYAMNYVHPLRIRWP